MNRKILILFALLAVIPCTRVFADDSAQSGDESYEEVDFPSWLLALRRSEIVTLGSVPFTTLAVTLTYSTVQFATGRSENFPSPFSKNAGYTQDDVKMIAGISLGVSLVIGVVDLVINLVRQKNRQKIQERARLESNGITVTPVPSYQSASEAHENDALENSGDGE